MEVSVHDSRMVAALGASFDGRQQVTAARHAQRQGSTRLVACAGLLVAAALAIAALSSGANGGESKAAGLISSPRQLSDAGRHSRLGKGQQQLQLNSMQPDESDSPFFYDVPDWVNGQDSDYSSISRQDMINSIDESMTAGLPRDNFISKLKKELPDDVAKSCDFTVDPCVNFYEFACGTWIKDTVIPPHEGKVLKSWGLTDKKVKRELRDAFEAPHGNQPEFSRLSEWYDACMDTDEIDRVGLSDLNRVLAHVDAIEDEESLQDALVYLAVLNLQSIFKFKVNLPAGQHDHYTLYIKPSGLTMANPAIYLRDDAQNTRLIADLRDHFIKLHQLTGLTLEQATQTAEDALHMEVTLAKFHAEAPSEEMKWLSSKGDGKYTLSEIADGSPNLPWRRVFTAIQDKCHELEGATVPCLASVTDDKPVIAMTKGVWWVGVGV